MTIRFGHYQTAGLSLAVAAVAALVLHLALPFAHLDTDGSSGFFGTDGSDETYTWNEANDDLDGDGNPNPGMAHLEVTLTGAILMVVAGLLVTLFGFLPLNVDAARTIGWITGLVGVVGGLMATVSSALWTGLGFETFLELLFGESSARLWIISPVFVTLAGTVGLLASLRLCGTVIARRDGLREEAETHLRTATWATLFLVAVLILPWSIQLLDNGENNFLFGSPEDQTDFVSALTAMRYENASDGALFGSLTYAVGVFIAAGWIGVLAVVAGTLGHLVASLNEHLQGARKATTASAFLTAFLLLWASVLYVLAWSYMWKPNWDESGAGTWMPAILPIVAAPLLAMWAIGIARILRGLGSAMTSKDRVQVSFD